MAMRTLFVTGGNTGLGWESIKALLESSNTYNILMGSRSISKAEDAIKALQKEVPETKSTVTPVQIDVVDDTSIENAFKEISSKHGHLDVLINNSGNCS